MLTVAQITRYLSVFYPAAFPGQNCTIIDSPSAGAVISVWQIDGVACPTNGSMESAITNPASSFYTTQKSIAAEQLQQIVFATKAAYVPAEKEAEYERKEAAAKTWDTTADADLKSIATEEFSGYQDYMAATGAGYVTLQLGNVFDVQVASLGDLLNTYLANSRILSAVSGKLVRWRKTYAMQCVDLTPVIDPAAGDAIADLDSQIAALTAGLQADIARLPDMAALLIPGLLTEFGLTPA